MTFIKHAANTSYRALASVSVGFGTVSAAFCLFGIIAGTFVLFSTEPNPVPVLLLGFIRVPTGAIGLITGLIGLKSRTKKATIGVTLSAGALIMGIVLILCLAIKVGLTPHTIR